MDLIASTDALAAACARLAAHPFVTVDTEFLRETTYYPKLCLIQMATPDEGVLVDPLAPGLDLEPFLALMANEAVLKVFHSARQDLEIVWNLGRLVPQPLFDTQVAAMVCGYGDSVSYEQLVNDLAKERIDKSSRFTDWSRRPLSEAQLAYALSDVTHLVKVYEALAAELERTGRSAWLTEEMEVLTSPGNLSGRSRECLAAARRPPAQAARDRRADGGRGLARARGAGARRAARPHAQGRGGPSTSPSRPRAASRRWGACGPSRMASSARARGATSSPPWSGASPATRRPFRRRSGRAGAAATALRSNC